MRRPVSDWMVTESGVYILQGDGYRITYNPSTLYTFNYRKMRDPDFQFEEDVETEETALYIQEEGRYCILDGDFREEFQACTTLRQCLIVFQRYAPRYRSKWSMDQMQKPR